MDLKKVIGWQTRTWTYFNIHDIRSGHLKIEKKKSNVNYF